MISNQILHIIPEPRLEFRYGQMLCDPHDGLAMFGPFDSGASHHPPTISYGVVGTTSGVALFREFSSRIQGPIFPPLEMSRQLWPIFPGTDSVLHSKWPTTPTREHVLDERALERETDDEDAYRRVGCVVDRFLGGIEDITKRDESVHLIVCVVPDVVYENCRPKSRVITGIGYPISSKEQRARSKGQRNLFESYDPEHYRYSRDFRRQIKARAMSFGCPIQIVRESTLTLSDQIEMGERGLTPLCDRAWNLMVASYYKAGAKPWRLSTARDGVCYIGIAYRLTESEVHSRSACCAAQMFLDSGDGIVFKGETGPWYSPEWKEFHLSQTAAQKLLTGVLESYRSFGGKPLTEIFLHCHSSINDDEFAGFQAACPGGVKLVGIRVRSAFGGGLRLFREGSRPVLRGTYWEESRRTCFLWASGFKPRLGTYDGWEVPVPLRIDIQHGEAEPLQVAQDIFGLTKLNYNACKLGSSMPVTVGFSRDVGEILVSNPTIRNPDQRFKFYI